MNAVNSAYRRVDAGFKYSTLCIESSVLCARGCGCRSCVVPLRCGPPVGAHGGGFRPGGKGRGHEGTGTPLQRRSRASRRRRSRCSGCRRPRSLLGGAGARRSGEQPISCLSAEPLHHSPSGCSWHLSLYPQLALSPRARERRGLNEVELANSKGGRSERRGRSGRHLAATSKHSAGWQGPPLKFQKVPCL
jgi:hypothetical protein